MKVATYNIHYGIGLDGRLDLERVINCVRDADIIALQEVESGWDRTGNSNQPELIKGLLPHHESAWGPTIDVRKMDSQDQPASHGARRQFGNMILSRYPIISVRNFLFPKYGGVRYLEMQKGALEVVLNTPLGLLRFYSTHLCNSSEQQRERQVQCLVDHHVRAPDEGPVLSGQHFDPTWTAEPPLPPMPGEAILCGDFNFEPDTHAYELIAGEFNPRYGHLSRRAGFVDAWAEQHGDPMLRGGGPGGETLVHGHARRFDYCFVTPALAPSIRAVDVLAEADGSDHQPIIVSMADGYEATA